MKKLLAERNPPCLLRLLCGRWGGTVAALMLCPLIQAQNCAKQTRFTPFGMVVMFRNGGMIKIADYTMTAVPGSSRPSFTPNRFADQDAIAIMYTRAMNLPGTTTPWGYSLVREEWTCTGWQPALTFSLDSAQAPSATNLATLHLTFTNAVIVAYALQFNVVFDAAVVQSFAAATGPVATNAGKNVQCSLQVPGTYKCLVTGINCNPIQDGEVVDISLTVNPASLPTTVSISSASGTILGTNFAGSIAIPGIVSPSSTGIITAGP